VTAADVLAECRRRGIELAADGPRLRFRPVEAVDPALRAALTAHNARVLAELWARGVAEALGGDLVALTRPRPAIDIATPPPDAREHCAERAAIIEFDGRLPRPTAERVALAEAHAAVFIDF